MAMIERLEIIKSRGVLGYTSTNYKVDQRRWFLTLPAKLRLQVYSDAPHLNAKRVSFGASRIFPAQVSRRDATCPIMPRAAMGGGETNI